MYPIMGAPFAVVLGQAKPWCAIVPSIIPRPIGVHTVPCLWTWQMCLLFGCCTNLLGGLWSRCERADLFAYFQMFPLSLLLSGDSFIQISLYSPRYDISPPTSMSVIDPWCLNCDCFFTTHWSPAYLSQVSPWQPCYNYVFPRLIWTHMLASPHLSSSVSVSPPYELISDTLLSYLVTGSTYNVFHVMLLLKICFTLPSIPKRLGVTISHFVVFLAIPAVQVCPLAYCAPLALLPHTDHVQICQKSPL